MDTLTAELCTAYDAVSVALDALQRARENAPNDEKLRVTVEKIERHARGLKDRLWDLQPGWRPLPQPEFCIYCRRLGHPCGDHQKRKWPQLRVGPGGIAVVVGEVRA